MLTAGEKIGMRQLLLQLEDEVVFSLAETVTKRALALTCVGDAVDAIILHSESAISFLNRKKLTWVLLFQYANREKIEVSSKVDKNTITNMILKHWNTSLEPATSQDGMSLEVSDLPSYSSQQPCNSVEQPAYSIQSSSCKGWDQNQEMALEFSKWFYGMLMSISNGSVNPTLGYHFWFDSRIKITMCNAENSDCMDAVGSSEVAQLLHDLLLRNRFILNPNLEGGVFGKRNQYGFVVIAACGIAHCNGNISGIFEQAFGLLQDPNAEFSWKVKWSELRITEAQVTRNPLVSDLPELLAVCDNYN